MTISGPHDGCRLLEALGIDTNRLTKAVITIELDDAVRVDCTRLLGFDANKDTLNYITETYEVTLRQQEERDGASRTP